MQHVIGMRKHENRSMMPAVAPGTTGEHTYEICSWYDMMMYHIKAATMREQVTAVKRQPLYSCYTVYNGNANVDTRVTAVVCYHCCA